MKRLIICCDGTWNDATDEGKVTNIVRLRRMITPHSEDHRVAQVVYYDSGVGTDGKVDAIAGGLYGEGMDRNVLDAFAFLMDNYEPGDLLFFFGFSRGAYTVRSLVGLINNAGLLKKEHADQLTPAYTLYRSKDPLDHPHGARAEDFRRLYSQEVSIHFLGVFDTVGALGIPLTFMDSYNAKKYSFHDTTLSRIVKHAFHAVAIDERRYDFYPTLWTAKEGTTSEQRWFVGSHSDIGGGYGDSHGLSDLPLKWMLTQAHACGLDYSLNSYHGFEPNPLATAHDSYTSFFKMVGQHRRHVCDSQQLKEHSILIPHHFDSKFSWFRAMKDSAAPHGLTHWWDVIGWLRLRFNPPGVCSMMDMKIDESVHQRLNHVPDYQPDNIMPYIRPMSVSSKKDIDPQPDCHAVGLVSSV